MQQTNLTNALQAISRSSKPLVTGVAETTNPVSKLEPGQQVRGVVQEQLSAGIFKVQVAGQTIQMRLPGNILSGEVINLKVINNKPQVTFSLVPSSSPISTQEQIGATAQMLSNLAEMPLEKSFVRQLGNSALWRATDATPDRKQLASALRNALATSGLFYESHQAQWVRGERSTSQLLLEPQNQFIAKGTSAPEINISSGNDGSSATGSSAALIGKSGNEMHLPVARELLPLVQQQLHTLETHQLTWVGQVWQGQQMQWEIQGQPEPHAPQPEEREWSTEMELALPKLGDVHARLVFSANGVKLNLSAADSATVALFNQSMSKLQAALADINIPLAAAVVEKS